MEEAQLAGGVALLELIASPSADAVRRPGTSHPSMRSFCEVCRRDTDEVRRFRCVRGDGFAVVVRICLVCLRSALRPGR